MAAENIPYGSTTPVQSTWAPGSATSAPSSWTTVTACKVTVAAGAQTLDIEVSPNNCSGTISVQIYVNDDLQETGNINSPSGKSLELKGLSIDPELSAVVTIKWKEATAGAQINAPGSLVLQLSAGDWVE